MYFHRIMQQNLLTALGCSGSLVLALAVTQPADASSLTTPTLNLTVPQMEAIANPASIGQETDRDILQYLGCTCTVCQGVVPQL